MENLAAPPHYEAHTAIALMREEHRSLRDHFEALVAVLREDVDRAAITDRAKRFMAICAKHFLHEEWAMRVSGFPDLASHQNEHYRVLSGANDTLCKLRSSALGRQERRSFADAYWHWMDNHRMSDNRFDEYCHELADERELVILPSRPKVHCIGREDLAFDLTPGSSGKLFK